MTEIPKRRQKWTNTRWKKELWKVFSLYIRTRDKFSCFTCPQNYSKRENLPYPSAIQAGHFIEKSVGGLVLYFDEKNVHAQCYQCNINRGGYHSEYYPRMIKKYGQELVDELQHLKRNGYRKISDLEYVNLIEEYQNKLECLLQKDN